MTSGPWTAAAALGHTKRRSAPSATGGARRVKRPGELAQITKFER